MRLINDHLSFISLYLSTWGVFRAVFDISLEFVGTNSTVCPALSLFMLSIPFRSSVDAHSLEGHFSSKFMEFFSLESFSAVYWQCFSFVEIVGQVFDLLW